MRKPLLILVALALAVPIAPASATDTTLDNPGETIAWPGRAYTTTDAPVPDTFDLDIQLPADYWTSHDGGVEVAVRWRSEYNLFDLYVLNLENQVLASATGFPTSAQSLILPHPANGLYHVVVVPQIQVDDAYSGIAQVELKPAATGGLLPDLVALPPDNFKIASGAYSFLPVQNDDMSCYPEEQVEQAVTRCLRFDTAVANLGDGPFELRLDISTVESEHPDVFQDLYDRDGNAVAGDSTFAGQYTFHKTHGHIHYQNFATYGLYTLVGGQPGTEVKASRKADFCMIDTRLLRFGLLGNGARNHHFPNCNIPATEGGGPTTMRQGIDVGWADVYTWDLPGQYIDISTLPAGDYAVVIHVNPVLILQELSTANDVSFTPVHIDASGVTELS
jgi:lysyl oxidase